MPYRIVIQFEDPAMNPERVRDVASFLGEALDRMQTSYEISCYKDDMKLMMSISNPEEPV